MKRIVAAWLAAVVVTAFVSVAGADEAPKSEKPKDKSSEGKDVFIKYKCRSCHTVESQGITKKAEEPEEAEKTEKTEKTEKEKEPPDLSGVGLKHKTDWMTLFLQKKEKLEGKVHTKKFRGTDAELAKLTVWLATLKTEAKKEKSGGKSEDE